NSPTATAVRNAPEPKVRNPPATGLRLRPRRRPQRRWAAPPGHRTRRREKPKGEGPKEKQRLACRCAHEAEPRLVRKERRAPVRLVPCYGGARWPRNASRTTTASSSPSAPVHPSSTRSALSATR